jgi:hypothetical protein
MSADEIMRTFIEMGMAFCEWLAITPDERAQLEGRLRADPNLKGLSDFAHWLWVKGGTPTNATVLPRD